MCGERVCVCLCTRARALAGVGGGTCWASIADECVLNKLSQSASEITPGGGVRRWQVCAGAYCGAAVKDTHHGGGARAGCVLAERHPKRREAAAP